MLKIWNVSLVLATGTLAIMGTFLVRSGVLDSIHAFGGHTLGVPFVILIAVMIAGSIYLVVSRRDMLRSEHRLDSLLSREAVFLANNVVLVGLCFVIFWGTYFPLISEAVTGQEASVGPPWFDRYTVPLALILVLLSGIGPVIAWRRATLANARRNFLVPLGLRAGDARRRCWPRASTQKPFALAMFCCAAFVFGSVGQEFFRGARARRAMARRGGAARAARAGAAQPPPLRRLHRAHRHRRAVRRRRRLLVLPARLRARPVARPVDARRRLHGPLRQADGDDHAQVRPGSHRLDAEPRRGARRHQERPPRHDAEPERGLLRLRGTPAKGPSAASSAASRSATSRWTRASRATSGRRSSRTSKRRR